MIKTLDDLVDYLVGNALVEPIISSNPPDKQRKRALEQGQEIPERAMPGYIIKNLPNELKELVKKLTWKHFWHCVPSFWKNKNGR